MPGWRILFGMMVTLMLGPASAAEDFLAGSKLYADVARRQDDAATALTAGWRAAPASNCVNASIAWLAYITDGPAPI